MPDLCTNLQGSHFTQIGGTQDYAYGQLAAWSLAIVNPAEAIMNADSHEVSTIMHKTRLTVSDCNNHSTSLRTTPLSRKTQ